MNLSRRPVRAVSSISPIAYDGGVFGVPLSDGSVALVDEADLPLVTPFPWFRGPSGHARTKSARANTYMHRLILGVTSGEVDHINRNPLDNRRCNLRLASRGQNVSNTVRVSKSGFRGVRGQRSGRFDAHIKIDGRRKYLGVFDTAEEAARAYDAAAVAAFGEFATLNFSVRDHAPILAARPRESGGTILPEDSP